ncbi:MAG: glucose-1-phosphate cytidylyltransferase [Elusimicrobia bacterium RIFOXYA1_FULL_47_7]|nr:MAG: glucose-1-phosphate cytidylyltransferase [Elusimicrobia bacterium RIFOXYA12_FULL_49_49]OGS06020.1 MAG: glucose-1-phosphate cytidylyltransferase [Elusimicrobia bacterium RIFOXYA1_FULL_47_7]OGS16808.1 MAG: glucose-1-phosphate cytidylyltransferase [Elusimicrobia bacterium RIFOXYA2_FULL_47_53]OGS32036.1 MAG: glucose-1-phosphate cytidylyltransferase [Elusimicrobia bacterium RIFOXYB2_FULL_46_23]
MKVVILAGGMGTRISEETNIVPKPMIEIGGKPILWHIMKTYSHYGFNEFIICLGYKGYLLKEYFSHYLMHTSDITIDIANNKTEIHNTFSDPWKITLIDTGQSTMTGGRIKKIQRYVNNEPFMLTYGDGVGNVNINELLKFHKTHGKAATITAVQPTGRFGALEIQKENAVRSFFEKPVGDGTWVNGGFFVLEPKIFDYIKEDSTTWEREPLENLGKDNQLVAYKHHGFWKPMDTLRDKIELEKLWQSGSAPWQIWK